MLYIEQCNSVLALKTEISQRINSELLIKNMEVECEKAFLGTIFLHMTLDRKKKSNFLKTTLI